MTQAASLDAVKRFLIDIVVSVERLHVLLFMYRHASRWWAAQKVAVELAMPADAVHSHLEQLSAHNLLDVRIAESVIFCYKPGREELAKLVEAVAGQHFAGQDTVVAVLTGRPADSARLFAEAFQFRKGKRDG